MNTRPISQSGRSRHRPSTKSGTPSAAGEGRAPAADPIRSHRHAGGPRPRVAPRGSSSRADLLGVVPAGAEQSRGHPGRDRLARRRRPPLAVGFRHTDDDGLRDSSRSRLRRCGNGPRDRLLGGAGARRVGAVSPLHRGAAPDMSGAPAPADKAPARRPPTQPVGRPVSFGIRRSTRPTGAPNRPSGPPSSPARCAAAIALGTVPTPSRCSPASCGQPTNVTSTSPP